jgi:RNA polymerase sigma-70 factor (ECF subfamily)
MLEKPEKEIKKLVKKAKGGEPDSFGLIYDYYLTRVYRFVFLKVTNKEEAEDITQQVFMKAWEALPRFESEGSPFVSWIFRIARNTVIDFYRTKKHNLSLDEGIGVDDVLENSPEDIFFQNQEKAQVIKALENLTDDQKEVVTLRFVEGFSYKEISAITEKNQASLRIMQHRAIKKLKEVYKELENKE